MPSDTTPHLDYRAFWTTRQPAGWLPNVIDLTQQWLTQKKIEAVDVSRDGVVAQQDLRVDVRHHRTDASTAMRLVMTETNRGGTFITNLTAVENQRGGGFVSLDVVNPAGGFVFRPNLALTLLDRQPMLDGGERLRRTPTVLHTVDDVTGLLAVLQAPERRSPVLVAGTDGQLPWERFPQLVTDWAAQTTGMAHVFVLDPDATTTLNALVGRRWGVPSWTIRTYQQGIDLDDPAGARGNRILGTDRLGKDRETHLRRLLGTFVRDSHRRLPVPTAWREWQTTFDRIATDELSAASQVVPARRHAAPMPLDAAHRPSDLHPAERELERVRETLGLIDLSDASLLDLLDDATAARIDPAVHTEALNRLRAANERADRLASELDASLQNALDALADVEKAEERLDEARRRTRYLERMLVEINRADLLYGEPTAADEPTAAARYGDMPGTFAELVERLSDLEPFGVVFTGDVKAAVELDYLGGPATLLTSAWGSLVALCEYVRAKDEKVANGSVHKFLEDQPAGFETFPITQHAATETGFTKNQWKGTRSFPVPPEVSKDGRADMYEHFKLGRFARLDPRLHYFDDTAKTGKVYVGYIGTHLVNSMTST